MPQRVQFDTIRTVAHASITSSYVALGGALGFTTRIICITNNTDGDMLFSLDGTDDEMFVAAGSYKTYDFNTNRDLQDPMFALAVGQQFYIKYSSSPSKGAVYIECVYGN